MFVGDILCRSFAAGYAGIVDQDVDPAVAGHNLVGGLRDAAGIGDVHFDRSEGRLAQGFWVTIGNDHRRTHFGKRFGTGMTDACRTAGDQRDAAIKLQPFEITAHGR
jgi:hypothetical protein